MHNGFVRKLAMAGVCATLGLSACVARASGPYVELDGHRFQIEIAADEASRERGLMFRESMPSDHGMLFVFDDAQVRTFWMKNTHIPLDILYFDQNYKLVSVQRRVPPCLNSGNNCPGYPSEGEARYALELNAGMADKFGVKAGDVLDVHR
jgi:uncharacterized membrane protein (UPF0127 family)